MSDNNEIQHPKKEAMIQALEKHLGVVTSACKTVGIDRTTHYRWLKEDEAYKQAAEDIVNVSLDFAESQLLKQIKDGNTTATIFYLKTIGKNRGYVERQEWTGKDGKDLPKLQVQIVSPDESK
jgi:hypothetical protein